MRALTDNVHYDLPAIDQDAAGIGPLDASKNLHQRAFARTVFSDHGQNLTVIQ